MSQRTGNIKIMELSLALDDQRRPIIASLDGLSGDHLQRPVLLGLVLPGPDAAIQLD